MKGGTTFHFVTDGIHSTLEQAKDAAGEKDVRSRVSAQDQTRFIKSSSECSLRLLRW
jgi:hypothetical protein